MKLRSLLMIAALSCGTFALPAAAQTIASKVEYLGNARYVTISGLMAKERNGFLMLQIELTSDSSKPRRGFWRVKWLDESGFQVWDDEAWKPVTVQGEARQNLQAVAPTNKARDFRIQFNAEENWHGGGGSNNSDNNI
jgi:uncharacterized protein YcfL